MMLTVSLLVNQDCIWETYYGILKVETKVNKTKPISQQMQSRQIISMDQSRQIIQTFFRVKFKFVQLLKKHKSNHKDNQIIQHVKKIFITMILDMERQLMLAGRIRTMQLYENQSDQMFNYLMNLQDILSQEHISDFTIYYRNRVSRVTVYQTDLIPSDKRYSIYMAFIKYVTDHDLFRFCIRQQQYGWNLELIQDPMHIYTSQDLQMLYKLYIQENGNLQLMQKKIKKQGRYKTTKYQGQLLKHNILNIYLIGLYRVYKAARRQGVRPCNGWQTFSSRYFKSLEKFTTQHLKILFRVAVYDNAKTSEIIQISKQIKKRFEKNNGLPSVQPKRVRQENQKKQKFMSALLQQIKKIVSEE